ncbi:MAG TPA: HD domain-containing protein, partial [Ktedonobacterales bacterium]|nr:HD domain-containing protein [Ktedonobacterales bacterium]
MSAGPVARSAHRTPNPLDRGAGSGGLLGKAARPFAHADPLYGVVRVAGWAAALLATPPFQRLAGVSLSDVPGELLFGRPFPSRLDHAIGVYSLARAARPRDRALQAAALAHDLGHGPFSHLTELLMIERCGEDHETRSARLLADVRAALPAPAARQLAWLDWDEVAQLVLGGGADGRGAQLNGRLDYDNADNVARFLLASDLGIPGYDPRTLARTLRLLPPTLAVDSAADDHVYLQAAAEPEALAWQRDRATVYAYLHTGHHNLAAHAMLRKAIDLAAATNILPPDFFDCTDAQALALLSRALDRGLLALVQRVRTGEARVHRCVWEAEVPLESPAIPATLARWRERLALEARLAGEAALAPHEVIVETIVSNANRALPPIAAGNSPNSLTALTRQPEPPAAPRLLHLFAACDAGPDYVR